MRLVTLAAILLLVAGVVGLQPARGQGTVYTITVSGLGTAAGEPDIAYIDIGAEVLNTNLTAALAKASEISGNVTQALLALKIAPVDIQAAKMAVTPQDRVDPRTGPTGNFIYRVRNTIRVTVRNMAQVNPAINAAATAGANVIENFVLSINDLTALEVEARARAVRSAQERAKQLADALGVTVGDAVIISEDLINPLTLMGPIVPVGGDIRGAIIEKNNAPNAGQLVVTVRITVTFSIRSQR
jgi:uncharacterized protein YggE